MAPMQTINLRQPIAAAYIVPETQGRREPAVARDPSAICNPPSEDFCGEFPQQAPELARLLTTLNTITDGLRQLHEQTVANHRGQLAKLAVEIARRILMYKVAQG